MRKKYVAFVALGLVTLLNTTVIGETFDGAVVFVAFNIRSDPAVAVLAVQPVDVPIVAVTDEKVEPVTEKPVGVTHVPDAVVQAVNEAD